MKESEWKGVNLFEEENLQRINEYEIDQVISKSHNQLNHIIKDDDKEKV